MSSDRNTNRPPKLAANRTTRSPLTPRVPASAPATARPAPARTPTVRTEPPTPRVKAPSTPNSDVTSALNVTPRSSARKIRLTDSANSTPTQDDHTPSAPRVRSTIASSQPTGTRNGQKGGLSMSSGVKRASRPNSVVSDSGSKLSSPLLRSPGFSDASSKSLDETIESRFFHASDAPKHERPPPKKLEPRKVSAFFYADGKKEATKQAPKKTSSNATSPVLSAVEQRSSGPWIRPDNGSHLSKSPPMLSPGLSSLSATSPFFPQPAPHPGKPRSPSPSKENIHLSYRKGVSQIFGTRPLSRPTSVIEEPQQSPIKATRKASVDSTSGPSPGHRKSPSLSSIDSGNSPQARRRSATTAEPAPTPSPLAHEMKSATVPRLAKPPNHIPSIDTSLELPASAIGSPPPESAMSPTKAISELAADARRERKVLDLEISNSSLLAINASLEKEMRKQKAELKRFRRLSRAGRLSTLVPERAARFSEGLSVVGEEDEDDFDPTSALDGLHSDMSDDEDDDGSSILSSNEPRSPGQDAHRLAKDEKKLQLDLAKHKELLVQSQMMNQSLKRCMFATEDMIAQGKKALEYSVRVSDVKLGGRVLSPHQDADADNGADEEAAEIEVSDNDYHGLNNDEDDESDHRRFSLDQQVDDSNDHFSQAKGLLDMWSGLGLDGSSEGGDRDSGIEADRPFTVPMAQRIGNLSDMGRPPGVHPSIGGRPSVGREMTVD